MRALPFIQAPSEPKKRRCGTAATGILEIPELGGLTVGEASRISDLMAKEQSSFVRGARVADAIAKAEGISISEAFTIIENTIRGLPLEAEAEAIQLRHSTQIDEVTKVYNAFGQRNMAATVTAIVQCRLEMPEWTIEDTEQMPVALFNAIWKLAQDEQEAEDQEPAAPPDDATLGKRQRGRGSDPKPTGEPSLSI